MPSARSIAPWLIVAALLAAAAGSALARVEGFAGMTLTDALLALEARGLKLLFTSHVVRPEMRVETEPAATEPRAILDELLAPHGLEARASGDTLVIVAATSGPATIRGLVRERFNLRPLAGAQVLVPGTGHTTTTAPDGAFSLGEVTPGSYTVETRLPGFVVARRHDVEVVPGRATELSFELVPAPVPLDEIVVTPSQITLLRPDPTSALAFERDEILALPHLGNDLFRALTLLPGVSGNELSAEFHVRGGRADEVLVMLDQLELFEPFHLRDFSNALSIIAPQAIAEVDLILGGFPARFGDRMGGVLDMTTAAREEEEKTHLGVSLLSAQAGSAGELAGGRGDWLAVGRFGSLELASSYLSEEEQPTYWDLFAKLGYRLSPTHRVGLRLLETGDHLTFEVREDDDLERADTSYGNSYLWLLHQTLFGSELFVDSVLSRGRIDRDRRAGENKGDDESFIIRDQRILDVVGLRQEWNYAPGNGSGGRHYLRWGVDLRRLETAYDYRNTRELEDFLAPIRSEPRTGTTAFRGRPRGEQYGVFLSDRVRLFRPLTVELGLRYDEQTITADRDLSPRFNLVYALGERSTLRAAWGHYFQSQRPYELQVEDGETRFFSSELTEQTALGLERVFPRGETLRVELYHRDIRNPRPRFENVFEPVTPFPEIEPDRVRFAPERTRGYGVEIFLRGRETRRLGWWLGYTYSRIEDETGGRTTPRGIDQPHALTADLAVKLDSGWTLNLAFRYHTGWPTTRVTAALAEDDPGELEAVPVFGPLNGERLPDYHRLDLRASRRWTLRKGVLTFFLELQNLYARDNLSGFDAEPELAVAPDGRAVLVPVEETWGGFLPSFGIDWKF